jgi:hypothetical protein
VAVLSGETTAAIVGEGDDVWAEGEEDKTGWVGDIAVCSEYCQDVTSS